MSRLYSDSEHGPVPVCPACHRILASGGPHACMPTVSAWPWIMSAIIIGPLSGLIALGIIFRHLAHVPNPPSDRPVIESHR